VDGLGLRHRADERSGRGCLCVSFHEEFSKKPAHNRLVTDIETSYYLPNFRPE